MPLSQYPHPVTMHRGLCATYPVPQGTIVVSPTQPPARPALRPAERYGELKPVWHRQGARVLAAVLASLLVGWVLWVTLDDRQPQVNTQDLGFTIISNSQIRATFDVTRPPETALTCTVEALNPSFLVVGVERIEVPASDPSKAQRWSGVTSRVTAVVNTQEPAHSARVRGCDINN